MKVTRTDASCDDDDQHDPSPPPLGMEGERGRGGNIGMPGDCARIPIEVETGAKALP